MNVYALIINSIEAVTLPETHTFFKIQKELDGFMPRVPLNRGI